jgi:predicted SAM-dependent methyltransferase
MIAPTKLHLGCGPRHIPGFFHVDALAAPHVDYVGPVEKLDFLESNTVELIYSSHLLEHFGRHEVDHVLLEWFRVLKPAGILRLAVPDFYQCAKLYVDGKLPGGLSAITGLIVGGQKDQYDYHKMIFDYSSLEERLLRVGFGEVSRWDWRTTEHRDVDDYSQAYLPHMDKISGALVSLNVEAKK